MSVWHDMALFFVHNKNINKRKEMWQMPNLTTPIPPKLTGRAETDVETLKRWGTALIDELSYLFNNLDSSNVVEAASVKAENIETTNAKITNAQIGALSADKLSAGSVDTGKVSVKDADGRLTISGSKIVIKDKRRERFTVSYDKSNDMFRFELFNEDGEKTVSIDSRGDAVFGGRLESAKIYASTIIGTDLESYEGVDGGVFADIDSTGVKIMQDEDGNRKQKIGMSVADDGTAYFILGAGNGSGKKVINGVVYANGSFKVEKNESYANMGIVGAKPFIHFWEDSDELWLSGDRVLINGTDVLKEISKMKNEIQALKPTEPN